MAISKKITFYAYLKTGQKIRFVIQETDFINVLSNLNKDVSDFLDDYSDRKNGAYLYKLCKDADIPMKISVYKKKS